MISIKLNSSLTKKVRDGTSKFPVLLGLKFKIIIYHYQRYIKYFFYILSMFSYNLFICCQPQGFLRQNVRFYLLMDD